MKRNVVCVDYSDSIEKVLEITKNLNNLGDFKLIKNYKIEDIKRKQGFLLIVFLDDIYEYYHLDNLFDYDNFDIYEFDRLYRKKLGKFNYTIILGAEIEDNKLPFANTYFLTYDIDCQRRFELVLKKIFEEDKKQKIKYTKKRLANIQKLKSSLLKMRKDYFKMEDLEKKLKVNKKWLQRYLKDMNYLYKNIGFNKKKRCWYIVKKTTIK